MFAIFCPICEFGPYFKLSASSTFGFLAEGSVINRRFGIWQYLLNTYCNRQIATVYCLTVGSSSAEGKISTFVGTLHSMFCFASAIRSSSLKRLASLCSSTPGLMVQRCPLPPPGPLPLVPPTLTNSGRRLRLCRIEFCQARLPRLA